MAPSTQSTMDEFFQEQAVDWWMVRKSIWGSHTSDSDFVLIFKPTFDTAICGQIRFLSHSLFSKCSVPHAFLYLKSALQIPNF